MQPAGYIRPSKSLSWTSKNLPVTITLFVHLQQFAQNALNIPSTTKNSTVPELLFEVTKLNFFTYEITDAFYHVQNVNVTH